MVIQQRGQKTVELVWVIFSIAVAGVVPAQAQMHYDEPGAGVEARPDNTAFEPADGLAEAEQVEVAVSRDGIVEMHIQDGQLYVVLQQLLLKSRRNIVFGKDVSGTVTVSLYNVTIDQALDAILQPNGFDYRTDGNFIYVYTQEELARILDEERVPVTRTFRLNYISPTDAARFIEPILTPEVGRITIAPPTSAGLSDGQTGAADGQSLAIEDVIMVRDYEDKLWEVEKMLAELDKRPKQVLVEATILRATLNEANALGIDFNVLGGVDFELQAAVDGRTGLIPNGPNSTLGGNTAGTNTGTGTTGLGTAAQNLGTLNNAVPISKLDDLTIGIGTNFAANVPGGGLTLGVVTDHVSLFIRALESVADVTVLSNPKVLTLNKQEGHVLVGSRDGFLTTQVTTETSTTQSVDFLETGTQLRFRPFISNDGYVRMRITPSDSTGGVDARGLPFERTTEVTTDILVKDGHTILIGGLFRDVSSTGRSQIPLLGSLPVVGAAFRSTNDSTIREEVIILLTVHIIEDESEYAAYTEEVWNDMERLRVGIRESMQFYGRERLAQANYHTALEYAASGDWDMAEWHTKLAIHNRPGFVDAIKLREEIVQQRSWDHEGTVTRDFVKNLILRKQGLPTQLYGRPVLPRMQDTREEQEIESTSDGAPTTPVEDEGQPTAIQVAAPAQVAEEWLDDDDESAVEESDCWEDFEGPDNADGHQPNQSEDADSEECDEVEPAPEDQVCEGDE